MTDDIPEGLDPTARPRAGCWVLTMPILMAILVVAGYATLLTAGFVGREASGERVELTYAGCEEAVPVVERRLAIMGLGEPIVAPAPGGFRVTATLPGDPKAAAGIPAALGRTALYEVRPVEGGEPLATSADVATATVRLDISATPKAAVELDEDAAKRLEAFMEAHPESGIAMSMDGEVISTRSNKPVQREGKLDLSPEQMTREPGIRQVAEWAVLLQSGPLPCEVELRGQRTLE